MEPSCAREEDSALLDRVHSLIADGREIWDRFDSEVRQERWHPFVPADYERVLRSLLELRAPGLRFLEWGSATGVITIMADLLGFEACGIELDPTLVDLARGLAARHDSGARFVAGSFLPDGYVWTPGDGDGRMGTIGQGRSGYDELGLSLDAFDLVYAYPWSGEEVMMRDLMRKRGRPGARLLLNSGIHGVRIFPND